MKKSFLLAASLILLAIASSVSAQATRPAATSKPSPRPGAPAAPAANVPLPDTRIALIDTTAFGDEKTGIKRYVNAVKLVAQEFQPRQTELNGIQSRIRALADEVNTLQKAGVVDPSTIQAKQDEGERLQRDLKYKKEQADADFEKRLGVVVAPISKEIGKALDQFASQRGITITLDLSKLSPAVLTLNTGMDVTQAFIADYNSKNP